MNENENLEIAQNTPEISQAEQTPNAQKEFLDNLKNVNSSYINIVMVCGCLAICGIIIAIHLMLWIGIGISFSSAIIYMILTKLLLIQKLGISYESTSGALTVTKITAKDKEEIFIPSRLLFVDVTKLSDNAFYNSKELRIVHLPATLSEIGKDVFNSCDALEKIYFEGSQDEFEKIACATDLGTFEIIFCDKAEYKIKKAKKEKNGNNDAPVDTEEEN